MSMAQPVNEDYDPDETAEKVLGVLKREQRANPYLIREELDDVRKQYVNDALRDLVNAGWIRKVSRGLYELVDDPREDSSTDGAESPASGAADSHEPDATVDIQALRRALDDIEAAVTNGSSNGFEDALERAREAIDDA